MEVHKPRKLFSYPFHAKEERNGPPSANQGLSTAKSRSNHVIANTHPLPHVLPFMLEQNLSPKSLLEVTSQAQILPT